MARFSPFTWARSSTVFQIGDNAVELAFQLRGEMGAAMMFNVERAYGVREGAYDEYLVHLASDGSTTYKSDSVARLPLGRPIPVDKRDHVRLQEVSVSYTVPEGMAGRIGLKRTTVTLSGYNLHWWDDCNCTDPSQKYHASDFVAMPFFGAAAAETVSSVGSGRGFDDRGWW